jgi:hypothetical protein
MKFLIINDDMGFWQEPDKAVFDAESLRGAPSVTGASCAPTVEFGPRAGEFSGVFYHAWNRVANWNS